jgi:hypothetical protein
MGLIPLLFAGAYTPAPAAASAFPRLSGNLSPAPESDQFTIAFPDTVDLFRREIPHQNPFLYGFPGAPNKITNLLFPSKHPIHFSPSVNQAPGLAA